MRDWIVATLALVFLSGGTTGYFLGQAGQELEVTRTWKDGYLEQLQSSVPEITPEDLSRARKIIETYEERVMALKSSVDRLIIEQLKVVAKESERELTAIIESYESKPGGGPGD